MKALRDEAEVEDFRDDFLEASAEGPAPPDAQRPPPIF